MSTHEPLDLDRLFKLRLAVARFGEMDASRWWNTGDSADRTAVLGLHGAQLFRGGFPRTHYFARARVVFTVARLRCNQIFAPSGCITLWNLPPNVEDQFDMRWPTWIDRLPDLISAFEILEPVPTNLTEVLTRLELFSNEDQDSLKNLRRSPSASSAQLVGIHEPTDFVLTMLAAGFALGEPDRPVIPYARTVDL